VGSLITKTLQFIGIEPRLEVSEADVTLPATIRHQGRQNMFSDSCSSGRSNYKPKSAAPHHAIKSDQPPSSLIHVEGTFRRGDADEVLNSPQQAGTVAPGPPLPVCAL